MMQLEDLKSKCEDPSGKSELYLELYDKICAQVSYMNEKKYLLDNINDIMNNPNMKMKTELIKNKLGQLKMVSDLEQYALLGFEKMIEQL